MPMLPEISVITPAYKEEANLEEMHERLCCVLDGAELSFEWIIVDDCSGDQTFDVAKKIAQTDPRVKILRLARNFGSHAAILCGLSKCCGKNAVVMASDLQDPPEAIPSLMQERDNGAEIVWAVREKRHGESFFTLVSSRIFYWLMRTLVKLKNFPANGADFFLISRKVIDVLQQFNERNVNIFALLMWIGFTQAQVPYAKMARKNGQSGWTFRQKVGLLIDSVVSFSFAPVRMLAIMGMVTTFGGFIYAMMIVVRAMFVTIPVDGWSSLMVAVLLFGGATLTMTGVLGEYVWRILAEARGRPIFIVDTAVGFDQNEQLATSDKNEGKVDE